MAENVIINPITDAESILKLIPQKPPFVMVDSLLEYTHLTGKMAFTIPVENILVKNGRFSEPGLIEHMAQSMSLHRGYRGYLAGLQKPQTGFIGAIKTVEIFKLPEAKETLTTYVQILQEVMKVTLVTASSYNQAGDLLATSEMKTVTVD